MREKARLLAAVALLTGLLAGLAQVSARAEASELRLIANATAPGLIDLFIYGPPGATVEVGESVDNRVLPIATVVITPRGGYFLRAARWRCDRRTRRFVASTVLPDGSTASVSFDVRTPSCAKRLSLKVPRRARLGKLVRAVVGDRWKIGGTRPRLCTLPPGGGRRCRTLRIPSGSTSLSRRFRASRRGVWRVELRTAQQRISRIVEVGVHTIPRRRHRPPRVLVTGDSMMQTLDSVLADRLEPRADVVSDVRIGTGVSKPGPSWIAHARRQAHRVRPAATVVFLGANDFFDMTTPKGEPLDCCGEPWINEYVRRVRKMMRAYRRRVLWLTVPVQRDPRRLAYTVAVNEGMRRAALATPGARIVDLAELFTPGLQYRAVMPFKGRQVKVRADDGVHLSVKGCKIAASVVVRELKRQRLFRRSG